VHPGKEAINIGDGELEFDLGSVHAHKYTSSAWLRA
jgi:hypothetical protein